MQARSAQERALAALVMILIFIYFVPIFFVRSSNKPAMLSLLYSCNDTIARLAANESVNADELRNTLQAMTTVIVAEGKKLHGSETSGGAESKGNEDESDAEEPRKYGGKGRKPKTTSVLYFGVFVRLQIA
jgi:hypothetical protein